MIGALACASALAPNFTPQRTRLMSRSGDVRATSPGWPWMAFDAWMRQDGMQNLRAELKENRRQRDYEEHKKLRYKWYAQQQEARKRGPALSWEIFDMMDPSIEDCENDFELAARAMKELEYQVDKYQQFYMHQKNPPKYFTSKINKARTAYDESLPEDLLERMRGLAQTRNALMHDRDFNALPSRTEFVHEWLAVLSELSLENGRLVAASRESFTEVLPRQPGDTFIRTRTRLVPWTDPAGKVREGAMDHPPRIEDLKAASLRPEDSEIDRMLSDLRKEFEAENGRAPDDAEVDRWRQTLELANADEADESGRRQGDKPRQKKPRRRSRRKK